MMATYACVDRTVKPSGPSVLHSDAEVGPCDDAYAPPEHVFPPSAPHTLLLLEALT